jgi:hypothetical protein
MWQEARRQRKVRRLDFEIRWWLGIWRIARMVRKSSWKRCQV